MWLLHIIPESFWKHNENIPGDTTHASDLCKLNPIKKNFFLKNIPLQFLFFYKENNHLLFSFLSFPFFIFYFWSCNFLSSQCSVKSGRCSFKRSTLSNKGSSAPAASRPGLGPGHTLSQAAADQRDAQKRLSTAELRREEKQGMGTERGGTYFMRLLQQGQGRSLIRMAFTHRLRESAKYKGLRQEEICWVSSRARWSAQAGGGRQEAWSVCCMCAFVHVCVRELRGLVGQGERLWVLV